MKQEIFDADGSGKDTIAFVYKKSLWMCILSRFSTLSKWLACQARKLEIRGWLIMIRL